MTKVLVIGATGSLATEVIKTLEKNPNVTLTLFARNISRLSGNHTKIQGVCKPRWRPRYNEPKHHYSNERGGSETHHCH